jgi:hypothetical protein
LPEDLVLLRRVRNRTGLFSSGFPSRVEQLRASAECARRGISQPAGLWRPRVLTYKLVYYSAPTLRAF